MLGPFLYRLAMIDAPTIEDAMAAADDIIGADDNNSIALTSSSN